jgi:type IV secretory pathway VirB6-like protein
MKDNQKVIIVSAGLIILGLYYFYKQSKQLAEIAKEETASVGSTTTTTPKADWNKVLKKGSQGVEVGILQKALKTLKVDNDFGALTEARLKKVMKVTETSLNNYNKFINKK